jgi:hypothetical protein
MAPRYVKPYVKPGKNDAAEAQAICEAATRPTMRLVEIKTAEQQSVPMLHRTRQLLVRQRTTSINSQPVHLAELGIVAGVGRNRVESLLMVIDDGDDCRRRPARPGGPQEPPMRAPPPGSMIGPSAGARCMSTGNPIFLALGSAYDESRRAPRRLR